MRFPFSKPKHTPQVQRMQEEAPAARNVESYPKYRIKSHPQFDDQARPAGFMWSVEVCSDRNSEWVGVQRFASCWENADGMDERIEPARWDIEEHGLAKAQILRLARYTAIQMWKTESDAIAYVAHMSCAETKTVRLRPDVDYSKSEVRIDNLLAPAAPPQNHLDRYPTTKELEAGHEEWEREARTKQLARELMEMGPLFAGRVVPEDPAEALKQAMESHMEWYGSKAQWSPGKRRSETLEPGSGLG